MGENSSQQSAFSDQLKQKASFPRLTADGCSLKAI
jgi:hypothetical protein